MIEINIKDMKKTTISIGGLFVLLLTGVFLNAQEPADTQNAPHLYRPRDTVQSLQDTIKYTDQPADTLTQQQRDSIAAREKFVRDSIAARLQFIQDSIFAREKFVRDSIARRKRMHDSLVFLKNELPFLLEASMRTISDEIVIHNTPIRIIGDTILSDFTFACLMFGFNKPYIPWKTTINLSDKPVEIKVDTVDKRIISIKTPEFYHFYNYDKNKRVIRINSRSVLVQKNNQKYFRSPVDSVFFDPKGRIVKIKKYSLYYLATPNLRQGPLKYTDLAWVNQYQYDYNNITNCEIVKLCERGTVNKTPDQVCSIINYAITKNGLNYTVKRNNDPPNSYSDGTFVFTYTSDYTLKSTSFNNVSNQENWITYIETKNEQGWVSRYVYKVNGKVNKTLLVNYYHDNPHAKHKYETISCVFEDDGISYQQINNTTKKMRIRDKLTMEWSDWK